MPGESIQRLELAVAHASDAARVRSETSRLATALGFDEVATGELAICASELAHNAVEHGGGHGSVGLELDQARRALALSQSDFGGGIELARAADRSRANRCDGEGLAAVGRLMDVTEISVAQGPGRRVRALRFCDGGRRSPRLRVVIVHRPLPGQHVSGDRAWFQRTEARLRLAVIDGLGHGPDAHKAAALAADTLEAGAAHSLERTMLAAHGALASTRGAALSVVELELATGQLCAIAVGNVRVTVHQSAAERWSPLGTEAIVGHGRPGSGGQLPLRLERCTFAREALLSMSSDGLSSSKLSGFPAPALRSDLVALALGQFGAAASERDDATLLVAGWS